MAPYMTLLEIVIFVNALIIGFSFGMFVSDRKFVRPANQRTRMVLNEWEKSMHETLKALQQRFDTMTTEPVVSPIQIKKEDL